MSNQPGTLYVVATPIGNLGDISARAVQILATVDAILAEDTRVSARLLGQHGIGTPVHSLHEHNERGRVPALVARLTGGQSLALISDAGTPLISDPGYLLVRAAHEADLPVRAVPGPSAVTAALSVCGLPVHRFAFEGFLAPRAAARRRALQALRSETRTLVLLEAPHRLAALLADLVDVFGAQRRVCLSRELTKLHETVRTGTAGELAQWVGADPDQQRGECVLVIEGAAAEGSLPAGQVLEVLLEYLPPRAAAAAAAAITGGRRNELYALALSRRQG